MILVGSSDINLLTRSKSRNAPSLNIGGVAEFQNVKYRSAVTAFAVVLELTRAFNV